MSTGLFILGFTTLSFMGLLTWRDMMRAVRSAPSPADSEAPDMNWPVLVGQAVFLALGFIILFILAFGYPSR